MTTTMIAPRTAFHTQTGRRKVNQDTVVVQELPGGRKVLAVADGMGGHRAGDLASRRAIEALVEALASGAPLVTAVEAANSAVYNLAAENPEWHGMGTTLVALLISGNRYTIASVGDSRAYRVDAAGVRQITVDHSLLAESERSGGDAAERLADSPLMHALTRAIGTEPDVEVDVFGPFDAEVPHTVVLCSDGLYRSVPKRRFREHLADSGDLASVAWSLAAEAYENGSTDNISIAIARFGTQDGVVEGPFPNVSLLMDWEPERPDVPPVDLPMQRAVGPESVGVKHGSASVGQSTVKRKRRRRRRGPRREPRRYTKLGVGIEITLLVLLAAGIIAVLLFF